MNLTIYINNKLSYTHRLTSIKCLARNQAKSLIAQPPILNIEVPDPTLHHKFRVTVFTSDLAFFRLIFPCFDRIEETTVGKIYVIFAKLPPVLIWSQIEKYTCQNRTSKKYEATFAKVYILALLLTITYRDRKMKSNWYTIFKS